MNIMKEFDEGVIQYEKPGVPYFGRKAKKGFWPSEASAIVHDPVMNRDTVVGKCQRASWYKKMKYTETNPVNARGYTIFMYGNSFEDYVQKVFINKGISFPSWCNVRFEHVVTGHPDGEPKTPLTLHIAGEVDQFVQDKDGKVYILEIKTGYGYFAKKELIGNKSQKGKPKIENLMQVMLYLDVYSDLVDSAFLIYNLRDSAARTSFKIELKAGLKDNKTTVPYINGALVEDRMPTLNSIYDRYFQLKKAVETKTMPDCDYYKEFPQEELDLLSNLKMLSIKDKKAYEKGTLKKCDFHCSYCPYLAQCTADSLTDEDLAAAEEAEEVAPPEQPRDPEEEAAVLQDNVGPSNTSKEAPF